MAQKTRSVARKLVKEDGKSKKTLFNIFSFYLQHLLSDEQIVGDSE